MRMQEARDKIAVLIRQEDRIYRCIDYMSHERPSVVDVYCNNLVEECANVVYDRSSFGGVINKVQSSVCISDIKDVAEQQQQHSSSHQQQTYTFWRQQMFDWACMVVDSYGMEREIVAVSFNLLDRYIAIESSKFNTPSITRDDYQLFSMTCLYLAVKILESYNRKLSVQTLVDMSKNYYTKEIIEATERDILKALDWYLHAPTGISCARLLAQLFPETISFHMEATAATLTEIAVADSFFVACKPSVVGLAAILHAARLEGMSDQHIQEFHTNLQGLIPTKECPEFRIVYLQLEKLYYH
jgi:Cyclin, N-terminal domain